MPGQVVIFEGLNGTGKTTLSRAFAERWEVPIARPFRNREPDAHTSYDETEEERNLAALTVPIATPANDLYAADMIGKLRPPRVVLDRSLITGLVYGNYDEEPAKSLRQWAREYYLECLTRHHSVVLFLLTAEYKTCRERVEATRPGRHPKKAEWSKLDKRYRHEVDKFSSMGVQVVKMSTGGVTIETSLRRIERSV